MASGFLRYSVEECLRKFCHTVSTERSYVGVEMADVSHPSECAFYPVNLFVQLSEDLSDHQSRAIEVEYFRAHLLRQNRAQKTSSSTTPSKSNDRNRNLDAPSSRAITDITKEAPTKICAGHFGQLFKALYSDGRQYKCAYGNGCKFKHLSKVGKTHLEILDIINHLPTTARDDLLKVVARKTA